MVHKSRRDGMRKSNVAATAQTVFFRRMRTVLIRPYGKGLIATTMYYDYELRSSEKALEKMPKTASAWAKALQRNC
ncbi:hypothetical protein IE4872_CH02884 [Rhizobium gallicum]|uniref:Ku domain-containing protein n=1 Tax=Rhizobium gallicum TaxID=56730 RepID=A0A1L5NKV7_9HYPH|nr:hypothetical protein IE4872_CH02884 [Rhizobium gallicum]